MRPWNFDTKRTKMVSDNRPFHQVYEMHYQLPNGSEIEKHLKIYHPDWMNMIVIKDKKVAFIKQFRPGIFDFTYELPGGIIDHPERGPIAALDIELKEELGLTRINMLDPVLIMSAAVNPSTHNNKCHTYLVVDPEKVFPYAGPEPTEDLEIKWVPHYEVIDFMKDNVVAALSLAPLWKYIYQFMDS